MTNGKCNAYALATGLTKRELFAAMAMQGLLAGDELLSLDTRDVSKFAVGHADDLIEVLNLQVKK